MAKRYQLLSVKLAVLRNTQTNYEYNSDQEAEDDIADPNSPTQRNL